MPSVSGAINTTMRCRRWQTSLWRIHLPFFSFFSMYFCRRANRKKISQAIIVNSINLSVFFNKKFNVSPVLINDRPVASKLYLWNLMWLLPNIVSVPLALPVYSFYVSLCSLLCVLLWKYLRLDRDEAQGINTPKHLSFAVVSRFSFLLLSSFHFMFVCFCFIPIVITAYMIPAKEAKKDTSVTPLQMKNTRQKDT